MKEGGGGDGGEWGKRHLCSKHCDEDRNKVIFSKPEATTEITILPWKDPTHVLEVMLCHASPVSLKFKSSASFNTTSESFKQKVQCDCNNSFLCRFAHLVILLIHSDFH